MAARLGLVGLGAGGWRFWGAACRKRQLSASELSGTLYRRSSRKTPQCPAPMGPAPAGERFLKILGKSDGSKSQRLATFPRSVCSEILRFGVDSPKKWDLSHFSPALEPGPCYRELPRIPISTHLGE